MKADDEFGFTERKPSLLERVLKPETRDKNNRWEDEEKEEEEENKSFRAGARVDAEQQGTSEEYSVNADDGAPNNNNRPVPVLLRAVDSCEEENKGVSCGSGTSGSGGGGGWPERDGSRGNDDQQVQPETGSEMAEESDKRSNERLGAIESVYSVSVGTPNIPNVVEYHLKVNPSNPPLKSVNREILGEKKSLGDNFDNDAKGGREKMRNDGATPAVISSLDETRDGKKGLTSALSRLSIDENVFEGSTELPQVFQVKYLGSHDARGLWGIKHTRNPVDNMVASAKSLPTDRILPLVKLVVSENGVSLLPIGKRKYEASDAACRLSKTHPIESISYGVQDLVYTRVFSMIVVRDSGNFRRISPFECHAFVCESKHHARQLTCALATAFQIYSQTVKSAHGVDDRSSERLTAGTEIVKKRFAIDLRSPEEIETDLNLDSEA